MESHETILKMRDTEAKAFKGVIDLQSIKVVNKHVLISFSTFYMIIKSFETRFILV